jgi:hypothetical protein
MSTLPLPLAPDPRGVPGTLRAELAEFLRVVEAELGPDQAVPPLGGGSPLSGPR